MSQSLSSESSGGLKEMRCLEDPFGGMFGKPDEEEEDEVVEIKALHFYVTHLLNNLPKCLHCH
jgi:hypothetical protein